MVYYSISAVWYITVQSIMLYYTMTFVEKLYIEWQMVCNKNILEPVAAVLLHESVRVGTLATIH